MCGYPPDFSGGASYSEVDRKFIDGAWASKFGQALKYHDCLWPSHNYLSSISITTTTITTTTM